MGEHPKRVFCFGAPGLDNLNSLTLLDRKAFEESIGFKLGSKNILITFHPVTLEKKSAGPHFNELLKALEKINGDTKFIFTKPNADTESHIIMKMIGEFVGKNTHRAISFDTLGQLNYLSALKHVDMVIGNSSSGLIEAPSFKIPTINIGDRQKGRIQAQTVISCNAVQKSIAEAIRKGFSNEFRDSIKDTINPYGDGKTSQRIKNKLKTVDINSDDPAHNLIRKEFYDIINI
jgi:GDP/UDP-N,N'-diacetylbacillosamine 2-epimerase (hydrolysing)